MPVHAEYIPELKQMAERTLAMHEKEKSSSDARYSLLSAHWYLMKAASALEQLSKN